MQTEEQEIKTPPFREMLPDSQWRCDQCRCAVYWYGWEKSRVIVTTQSGHVLSICLRCWPTAQHAKHKIPGFEHLNRYTFLGITTVKN